MLDYVCKVVGKVSQNTFPVGCIAAALLPKATERGTFKMYITKPSLQVATSDCANVCQVFARSNLAPAVLLRHVDVDLNGLSRLQCEVELLGRLLFLLRDLLLHTDS